MSSTNQGVYIMREADAGDGDGWVAPEPADEVIIDELLRATDLAREDVDPLTDHVDFEALAAVLTSDDERETLAFTVGGHDVTVSADGDIDVTVTQ